MAENQNLTPEQAQQKLIVSLSQLGYIGDGIEEAIQKIVASIPTVTRSQFDENPYLAAYAYYPEWVKLRENDPNFNKGEGAGKNNPGGDGMDKTPATGENKLTLKDIALPVSVKEALDKVNTADREQKRHELMAKTSIVKLVGDKPYPGTYIDANATMIPKNDLAKIEAYQVKGLLEDTPENKAAFDACVKAIKDREAIKVYIPEKDKWSAKLLGMVISTPAAEGEGSVEKTLTMDDALGFVAYELPGRITNTPDTIGCTLTTFKPRNSKTESSEFKLTPRLKIANRKLAFQKDNLHMFASQVKKNGNKTVTKTGRVRSELSFRVRSEDASKAKNSKGDIVYRRVRLSGEIAVPEFERVNPAIEATFGPANTSSNVIADPVTSKEKAAFKEIRDKTLWAMSQQGNSYGEYGAKFLEEFNSQSKSAGAPAAADGAQLDI